MNRTIHLIANPYGGTQDNRAMAHQAVSFIKGQGIQVTLEFTERKGHAREMAHSLTYSPETTLCGLGGDGTMHEIINGIMHRKPEEQMPVGLLPGGTGNSFLEDMGIFNCNEALQRIVHGSYSNVDLFKINLDDASHFVFNVCGWGLFASGNATAESLRYFKKMRYHLAGLWEILRNRNQQATLTIDNKATEACFSLIVASNTRNVGKSMLLSPKAECNDGKMDLLFLKQSGRLPLMRLFQKLPKGTHIHEPGIKYIQCKSYEIDSPSMTLWNLDGEIYSGRKGKVSILPQALKVCI